ncbi:MULTISPECIES: usg protein [Novosphingobium]|uniref:usg protein n=1 Tax=Novosphingobium TaxID=165696 RepID=UPI00078737E2|nr:usg protein [Novosphingobium capsulatum]WQD93824.1 usg protein [Novosphingobium capsulatum]
MARGGANTQQIDSGFLEQLAGYGLTTIEVHYYMPDHPALLQMFAFQQYDLAPRFPRLGGFLDHWRREIDAALHSIRIAHRHLIGPQEYRAVNGVITIN